MGLIRVKNKTISVSSKNGYSLEKVRLAKKYLDEIGKNRRHFSLDKLIEYYNEVKNANVVAGGCKPCQASKYYNGLQNYYTYGKLTLIANGIATEEEIDNPSVSVENVVDGSTVHEEEENVPVVSNEAIIDEEEEIDNPSVSVENVVDGSTVHEEEENVPVVSNEAIIDETEVVKVEKKTVKKRKEKNVKG